ncbi:MAG: LCP family protein, partial [Actinomyces graevenitzii]|nr:LCP family protein [Actinomyces graevenitzii]
MTASKLPPRHSAKELVNHRLRRFFYSTLAVVLFITSFGAMAWHDLQSSVNQIDANQFRIGNRPNKPVNDDYDGRAVNILVMGTDSRQGANNIDGGAATESSARSDTTMIMHISADRKRIQVVSIPRDTMVDIPECKSADGTITDSMYAQFNTAFANGAGSGDLSARALAAGAACAISTVEKLTNIYI